MSCTNTFNKDKQRIGVSHNANFIGVYAIYDKYGGNMA